MKVDTIRILVAWECNLSCSYCCNENHRFRKDIYGSFLEEIDFKKYSNVCISGGEPLMFMDRIRQVCELSKDKFIILYTNGIYLDIEKAHQLELMGVNAINIGLHNPSSFVNIIERVIKNTANTKMKIRFHVWDKYENMNLPDKYPSCDFKYWAMDDCDRDNEYRVILSDYEK